MAASCIFVTGGELNVSTSLVDDEGVDLVFPRRGGTATLVVQVKGRTSSSKRVASGGFVAFVRSQTFTPLPDLDMLFVAVDVEKAAIMHAWLVPSLEYAATLGHGPLPIFRVGEAERRGPVARSPAHGRRAAMAHPRTAE